jgi:tRNA-dihydrouridine synthase B
MSCFLFSSPLQGFTDFRFRNAFQHFFGGIDTFYSPYIRLFGKYEIKASYERDLLPINNSSINVIPQIMTNDANEFLFVAKYVQQLGYKELNWNLGCPYPMVTNRNLGSGLINNTKIIDDILNKVCQQSDIIVSMKMRLGYDKPSEILNLLPILDNYPIKNIAIHARIGKQLYKGDVDINSFQNCIEKSKHLLYYNGDITSLEKYHKLKNQFPSIENWMIGRGLISDPFLPQMIKNNTTEYPKDKYIIFKKFHDTLYNDYENSLSGNSHVLNKMQSFWDYFAFSFPESQKSIKKLKKTKNVKDYIEVFNRIIDENSN